jgi:hypothetical protein
MNHKQAIIARFPHFKNMFLFHGNDIVAVYKDFKWNSWNSETLRNYIAQISYCEKPSIERYTDFNKFIKRLYEAPIIQGPVKQKQE